jgi:O-antigen ligase
MVHVAVIERRSVAVPLVAAGAVAAGAVAAIEPVGVLGLIVAGGLVAMTFAAPVASLTLLLFLTCVVPYGIQNRLGVGGGEGAPGLLLSDLLLLTGLARAAFLLATRPLDKRLLRHCLILFAVLAVVGLQFFHGIRSGNDVSRAGQDGRVLLGLGTFFAAILILDDAAARRRLLAGLAALALLLGLWGVLQWFGHVSFGAAGDVGVRPGVRLTTAGTGQLQGGEYGFPVAVIACFAVLLSGAVRGTVPRTVLALALALNAIACLVTFERSFWLSALIGIALVLLRSPAAHRLKAVLATPFAVILALAALSAVAPGELATARERLLSLGQYASDDSVRYRVRESEHVLQQIRARPLAGSGLAATIFWGQPWAQAPPKSYAYSHNGYLWLAWRLGIPAAALLMIMLGFAVLRRPPPVDDGLTAALRRAAQGALAGVLVATVTFPSFSTLSITPVIGVLLALALAPLSRPGRPVPTARSARAMHY